MNILALYTLLLEMSTRGSFFLTWEVECYGCLEETKVEYP